MPGFFPEKPQRIEILPIFAVVFNQHQLARLQYVPGYENKPNKLNNNRIKRLLDILDLEFKFYSMVKNYYHIINNY